MFCNIALKFNGEKVHILSLTDNSILTFTFNKRLKTETKRNAYFDIVLYPDMTSCILYLLYINYMY